MRVYGAAIRALDRYYRGDLEAARVLLRDALSDTEAAVSQMAAALSAPLVAAALDDPTLVTPALEAIIDEARRTAVSPDDAGILAASAAWAASRGDLEQARADLRMALASMPRAAPNCGIPLALAAEYFDLSETDSFARLLDEREIPESDAVGRTNAMLARAILARRRGEDERASDLGTIAAAGYRGLEWPLLEARALEAAGRNDEARRIYARCGARALEARLASAVVPSSEGASGLSKRERDVVDLVARGLTNAAIADELGISIKTVEKHIAAAFAKLNVRSRTQLAAVHTRTAAVDAAAPERAETAKQCRGDFHDPVSLVYRQLRRGDELLRLGAGRKSRRLQSLRRLADGVGRAGEFKNKIMHASITTPVGTLMGADSSHPLGDASRVSLSITPAAADAQRIFDSLSEGGTVLMPFAEVFWGGKFGTVTDRYGFTWMLSVN